MVSSRLVAPQAQAHSCHLLVTGTSKRRQLHTTHRGIASTALLDVAANREVNIHVRLDAALGFMDWRHVPSSVVSRLRDVADAELQVCRHGVSPLPVPVTSHTLCTH